MSQFVLDATKINRLQEKVMAFGNGEKAEGIINDYLWTEGAETIKNRIHDRLPVSGRKPWSKKAIAAKSAQPFNVRKENLAVKIVTKYKYHYLYFPDDGSNTKNHYGNQQFMFDGALNSANKIIDDVVEKLIEKLEE